MSPKNQSIADLAKADGLTFALGQVEATIICTDPDALLEDAAQWRLNARTLLKVAMQSIANAKPDDAPGQLHELHQCMESSITLMDLAEAACEHACRLRGFNYAGDV